MFKACAGNQNIVVFGGMGINPHSVDPEDLIVLNDVWIYDIPAGRWRVGQALPVSGSSAPSVPLPRARYAHLSSITGSMLFVIGGQDINNSWLDDVCTYDLAADTWVARRPYPRHCGTYRSVAVAPQLSVRAPPPTGATLPGAPGTRFTKEGAPPDASLTASSSLMHQPYSCVPPDNEPCDLYLYSNYNVCPRLLL